jgi:hypothetical protein
VPTTVRIRPLADIFCPEANSRRLTAPSPALAKTADFRGSWRLARLLLSVRQQENDTNKEN